MYFVFARFLLSLFLHTNIEARKTTQLLHSICTQRTFTYLPSLFKQKNCYGQLTFLSVFYLAPLSKASPLDTIVLLLCKPTKKETKSTVNLIVRVFRYSFSLLFFYVQNSSAAPFLCHSFLLAIQVASLSLSLPSFSFRLACPN